ATASTGRSSPTCSRSPRQRRRLRPWSRPPCPAGLSPQCTCTTKGSASCRAWWRRMPRRCGLQEGFSAASSITLAELTLSWLLLDPTLGWVVNASSRRPVSVDRSWLTRETMARFTMVLSGVALDVA
ncbi:hypothetical protein CFC21_001868, partial [Triticum aestivum]